MQKYDYIVIGAGSAGCVLAERLSAHSNISVLVLEAGGPDDDEAIHTPALWPTLLGTKRDWAYETTPQIHCNNRQLPVPRGKMFGGSSSINAMIYQRGNRSDYDGWAKLGNEGWGCEDVLPYFKKAQHQERGPSEFHGEDGPLNVADMRDPNPLSIAFVRAAVEAGYAANLDFNGKTQEGFGLYQVTQKDGRRQSTAVAYLQPALKRDNLTAIPFAQVSRLTFDGSRCTGAVYAHEQQEHTVQAHREVIVCGGAINSPQLLMLSGIGPKEMLKDLGIDVVFDLPGVGQNLQEHIIVPHVYKSLQPISLLEANSPTEQARYKNEKRGLLTSGRGEAGGFIKFNADSILPEIQFHFVPAVGIFSSEFDNIHGFNLHPGLSNVKSVGEISLRSADPNEAPLINPNLLSEKRDRDILVKAVKISRQIARASALAPYRGEEIVPGLEVQSDAEILDYIRQWAVTVFHPVGSCKMGQDRMAVVNERLQVHGIRGLRVADASIMPKLINANTNAPAIMIGEKCADMILREL